MPPLREQARNRATAQASVQHKLITAWMAEHGEPTKPSSEPRAKRPTKRKARKTEAPAV